MADLFKKSENHWMNFMLFKGYIYSFYHFFIENVSFQPRFANCCENLLVILGLMYYFWPMPEGFFLS